MGRPRKYDSHADRQAAYRARRRLPQTPSPLPVVSAHTGENADMIAEACRLYIADGAWVADITYGRGAFWGKTDVHRFRLLLSDQGHIASARHLRQRALWGDHPQGVRADFRQLPYRDDSLDVVIFDPPYVHNPGQFLTEDRYRNSSTRGFYHADIMMLYQAGMAEAWRVLKAGGQLWVKCKDEIESSQQQWSHLEIYTLARTLGFKARDLFVLVPSAQVNPQRWSRQLHARKNHSYLWVFET